MSDLVQAVDVITKLLPQLKSFTGARRREYFTTLIQPLFGTFEDIHDFYLELILQTREEIIEIGWGSNPLVFSQQPAPLTPKQLRLLEKLRKAFGRKRQKDERLRDSLRQDARQMLMRILWPEERACLASVGDYFPGGKHTLLTDRDVQLQITALMHRGGDSYWDTPFSHLQLQLSEATDLSLAVEELDEMRNKLNQRYMNVRYSFKTMQHIIIERT